jgi:hypothetical protein
LNRAKESHQSTNRAPLSNSPAVSLFKTALSPTSCASAADILCYADCTLCSLDKPNMPYLTSFPQRYCCLQIAICLHEPMSAPSPYWTSHFYFPYLCEAWLLLQRRPHLIAPAHSNFSCLHPQPSGSNSPACGQHPGCSASQQHAWSASPKSNRLDMSSVFKQGFPWCL